MSMLLDAQSFVSAASIASAINVTVASLASPTELNSRAAQQGDLAIARTTGAASDDCTVYYADTSSDAQSLPYIVTSATSGVKWIAIAGRYRNGNFNSAALTASRLLRTDASKNLESNAVLTNTRVLYADSNGWPTDSANLTFSGTLLTLGTGATGGLSIAATTGKVIDVASTSSSATASSNSIFTAGGIGATGRIVSSTRLVGVGEAFSSYGVETTSGIGASNTTTNANGTYVFDYRRVSGTSSSGTHNSRAMSGSLYGTIASGQTNSGSWTGLWSECLRNYVATSDTGTLTTLEGCRITVGHFSTDASTPTTTTIKGLYLPLYRSTGTIGTFYGIHIDNGSTSITPTTAYGIKIENTTGTTAYALYTGTGLVSIGDTTDSTSATTGSITTLGGISWGVTKSAFGGGFKSTSPSLGIGYATGAGASVTQITSRTTGVTINNICGAITLVSAAGSAAYQTFTVTNSTVAATDTIIVNQKSGTDLNIILVTNVAAGSFKISFATTGGTTVEQPVFNFSVIKAVAA